MDLVLQKRKTLEEALLAEFEPKFNECRITLIYDCDNSKYYLKRGCAGMIFRGNNDINLLLNWIGDRGKREITNFISREAINKMLSTPPCPSCGGTLFKSTKYLSDISDLVGNCIKSN